MSTKFKIFVAIGLVVLAGLLIFAIFSKSNKKTNTIIPSSGITIKDKSGKDVVVNDFISIAVMNYGDVPVLETNDKFSIQYDNKNNVFQIYLDIIDASDLMSYRVESEGVLAEKLGLKLKDLCSLNVVENVPNIGTVDLPVYSYVPSVCDK